MGVLFPWTCFKQPRDIRDFSLMLWAAETQFKVCTSQQNLFYMFLKVCNESYFRPVNGNRSSQQLLALSQILFLS